MPAPQREALATAFGLSAGPPPDRFLVGLAVLSLLSDAAGEHPVVCLVDDVQWLDRSSAQVLAFVARRLAAESVVLLFAEREADRLDELAELPELPIDALADGSARKLLASVITPPLDDRVRARILAETRGNPLALLELPREFSAQESWPGVSDYQVTDRCQTGSRRASGGACNSYRPMRSGCCSWPQPIRPVSPPCCFARREEISVPMHQLSPAEADGLLELGVQVTFRHPLLRSAVYRAASSDERRAAHQALAAAIDPELDPDRRAWDRAHAIVGARRAKSRPSLSDPPSAPAHAVDSQPPLRSSNDQQRSRPTPPVGPTGPLKPPPADTWPAPPKKRSDCSPGRLPAH